MHDLGDPLVGSVGRSDLPDPGKNETVKSLSELQIQIYADGADRESMLRLNRDPLVKGFTTNPTLMRNSGVSDYERFARELLEEIHEKPISFEVLSEDPEEMYRQARKIASWGENVWVKIPVIDVHGGSLIDLIADLNGIGVRVNTTAITTYAQAHEVFDRISSDGAPMILSVFAGRIADTGRDPFSAMQRIRMLLYYDSSPVWLLWASCREVYSIAQASCTADIITVPVPILEKARKTWGAPLEELSLDVVRMFSRDAQVAGLQL